jgi:hypothetical protein
MSNPPLAVGSIVDESAFDDKPLPIGAVVDESAFSDKAAAPKMATTAAPRQETVSALPPESGLGALWDSFTSPYGKYRNEIAAAYKKSLYTIPAMVTEVGNLVAQGISDPIIASAAKAGVKLGVLDSVKDFIGKPAEYWSKKVQEADQQAQDAQVYSEPTGVAAQALGEGATGLVNTAPAMAKGAAIATALPEGAGGLVAGMIINTALESVRQGQDPKEAVRQVVAQAAPLVAMGAFGKIAAPASKVGRAVESMAGFETGSLAGGMLENKQQTPQDALATLGQAIPFAGMAMREGRVEPPPPQEQGLEERVAQATSPEALAAAEAPVQAENGQKAPEAANTTPEAVSPPTEAPTAAPAASEAKQGIPVTHMSASPEAFSEFSLDKAGTGEGAKIDNPENVRLNKLGVNVIEKPQEPVVPGEPETDLGRNLYGPLVATEDGQVHQVDATLNLKPDEILQREEPLTPEQVKAAGGLVNEGATGQDLMDAVRRMVGGNVDAERRIYQKLGFKAMAQMAEENQGQTRKFVVFDPKDLKVEQHTFYDENGNVVKSEAAPSKGEAVGAVDLPKYRLGEGGGGVQASDARPVADAIIRGLGTGTKVKVADRYEELPLRYGLALKENGYGKGGVQGFFDPQSDTVFVLARNHSDLGQVAETVLHEVVGHKGVEAILPGNKLDTLWSAVRNAHAGEVAEVADLYGYDSNKPADRRAIISEIIARRAEKMLGEQDRKWAGDRALQRAVAYVRNALRPILQKIGVTLNLTDNDILGILAKGRKALRDNAAISPRDLALKIQAYHGTPAEPFDKFSNEKIGSGEGNQAYGYGHYFAGRKEVAEWYAKHVGGVHSGVYAKGPDGKEYDMSGVDSIAWREHVLTPRIEALLGQKGQAEARPWARIPARSVRDYLAYYLQIGEPFEEARAHTINRLADQESEEARNLPPEKRPLLAQAFRAAIDALHSFEADDFRAGKPKRTLLKTTLAPNEEDLLDWDKPMSQQSAKVKAALDKWAQDNNAWSLHPKNLIPEFTGGNYYRYLSTVFGTAKQGDLTRENPEGASAALSAMGIPGIRYLDASSRSKGEGTHNYVIFNPEDVNIDEAIRFRRKREDKAASGEAGVIRPGEMLPVAAGRKALDIIMDKKLPVMSRMGDLADYAYRHAWAYIRAPQLVKAMIGRIAPTDRLKQLLPDFKEVADKDNILGLYDQRLAQAKEAAAKAAVAAQSGDKGAAQKFIKEAQDATKAAAAIKEAHPLKEYQEDVTRALADPEMALMFKNYKEKVQPEMDQLYQRTRGLDPNEELFHRGRNTGVHANLLTEESAQKWREWNGDSADTPMPDKTVNASQHMNPKVQRDRFARRAKGTGDYSSDLEAALSSAVAPRLNNATKIELYDAVVRNGAGYWADKPPDQMPEGDYKRFAVDMPNGTVRSLMVRSDVLPELKGVLNVDTRLPRSAALNALNSLQVSINPVDAIAHVANLTRRLLAAQGYGHSFTADLSRQASGPIGATLTTTAKFISTLMKMKRGGQPVLEQLARMADIGTARPISKPHGWGKLALGHYFIQTFDQAGRVMMDDLFSELVRRGAAVDTPANRREFVNHLGVYNRRVAGNIERALKDTGVSPFITAARRMPANAIEQLLLDPGFKATNKAEALKYRAANAAGIISTLMLPAIINSYTVGNPLGRPGTPFGAIDLGGKKDEDGKFATLDPLQWMGFRRGMRATGINAIIEGQRTGLPGGQIAGHVGEDIGQQFGHALLGPAMSFFFQAFTGRKLDLRGERVTANVPEAQTLERVRSALEAQNPVLYAALKPVFRKIYAQLDHELPETGATKPGPATKAMMALMGKPGEYVGGILESPWKSVAQAGGLKSVREPATAAQTEANTLMQSRLSELMTPEQQAKRELRLRLERQIRDGDPAARDAMRTALQNKQLTMDEAYGVLKKAQTHPLATTVASLGIPESFRVARLANPPELRAILPVIFGKLANTQDEAALAKYAPQLKALFEKARKQGQVPPIEELKQAAEDQTTETGGAK